MPYRRTASSLALLLALLVPATTLAASIAWTRQLGTSGEEAAGGIAADTTGVTIIATTAGSLAGPLRGPSDAVVRRYDRTGAVVWSRQYGTTGQDSGEDVAAGGGGIVVLVATDGPSGPTPATPGIRDVLVRRYDLTGTATWTRRSGTAADEDPGAVAADAGGVAVSGTTWGALGGPNAADDADAFVRRYSPTGAIFWTRQFGTVEADSANAVALDAAGITVAGGTDGNLAGPNAGPFTDAYIRRYDLAGKLLWTRQWGQAGDDTILALAADGTGITAVGYTSADASGEVPSQAFIRRYDRAGTLKWSRIFGTSNASEVAWGVAADGAGLTVTGYTYGSLDGQSKGSFDIFVRRYDRAGALTWRTQFGTTGADLGIDVAADGAGFTVLGHTNGALGGKPAGELDLVVRRYLR